MKPFSIVSPRPFVLSDFGSKPVPEGGSKLSPAESSKNPRNRAQENQENASTDDVNTIRVDFSIKQVSSSRPALMSKSTNSNGSTLGEGEVIYSAYGSTPNDRTVTTVEAKYTPKHKSGKRPSFMASWKRRHLRQDSLLPTRRDGNVPSVRVTAPPEGEDSLVSPDFSAMSKLTLGGNFALPRKKRQARKPLPLFETPDESNLDTSLPRMDKGKSKANGNEDASFAIEPSDMSAFFIDDSFNSAEGEVSNTGNLLDTSFASQESSNVTVVPKKYARSLAKKVKSIAQATTGKLTRFPSNTSSLRVEASSLTASDTSNASSRLSKASIMSGLSYISAHLRRFNCTALDEEIDSFVPEVPLSHASAILMTAAIACETANRILYFSYAPCFYPKEHSEGAPDSVHLLLTQPGLDSSPRFGSHRFVGVGVLNHYEHYTHKSGFIGLQHTGSGGVHGMLFDLSEEQLLGLVVWDDILYPNFRSSIDHAEGEPEAEGSAAATQRVQHELVSIKVEVKGPGRITGFVPCVTWA
ncbi:hypothetical protein DFH27DRAFT_600109 [Peziza echinospora]|nr:hypothetical protein DFH27DRAFT_600109 [Peziza echinospora]